MLKPFAKLFAATPAARTARRSIGLEALEDRTVPTVLFPVTSVGYGKTDAMLLITGTDTNSEVRIRQNDDTNRLEVEVKDTLSNGLVYTTTKTYTSSQITHIQLNLKGGSDRFVYYPTIGSSTLHDKAVTANLGEGDDTAILDTLTYSTKTLRAQLSIDINAGGGKDELRAEIGHVHSGDVSLVARLGTGDDTADVSLQGDISGNADVNVELYGEGGLDALIFEAVYDVKSYVLGQSPTLDVTGDSSLNVKLDGGTEADDLSLDLDGRLSGETTFALLGGAGADRLDAGVSLQGSSHGRLTGTVNGGSENDYLRLAVSGSATGTKSLSIDGGDGDNDRVWAFSSWYASVVNVEGTYLDYYR